MSRLDPSAPRAGSMETPYIFVSYARKDRELVYAEVERLERAGYRLWCDRRDIRVGREWLDEINDAIRKCACFLIFMSEGASTSETVGHEIDHALKHRKVVCAVYLEKQQPPTNHGCKIAHIQGIELFSLRKSEYEDALFVALFECVGAPGPPLQPPRPAPIDDSETVFVPPPGWAFPKVVFFSLLVSSGFIESLAVVAFVTPFFLILDPQNPLSDRLGGLLVGFLFSGVAGGLAGAAVVVHQLYLRRNHG